MEPTSMQSAIMSNCRFTCKFCGQPLKTKEYVLAGKKTTVPLWGTCGCAESKRQYDRLSETPLKQPSLTDRCMAAGIGSRFLKADTPCDDLLTAVKSGSGIYITGRVGSGKTTLAACLARKLIESGKTVRFESIVGLLRELKDSFDGTQTDAIDRAEKCDVLVLDDLGKQSPTTWTLSVIFEIVDSRYRNERPIIVTTNYTTDDLIRAMSANADKETAKAVVSRLIESSKLVKLGDVDKRLKGRSR